MNHTRLAELCQVAAVRVQVPEPDYNLNELIMEMYGNTLCVSFTELVRGGIISKPTYDKYVREGKLNILQRGGNGREALIAYRSMPEKLRAAYDDTFKNAYEEMKQREQESTSTHRSVSMPRRYDSSRNLNRASSHRASLNTF